MVMTYVLDEVLGLLVGLTLCLSVSLSVCWYVFNLVGRDTVIVLFIPLNDKKYEVFITRRRSDRSLVLSLSWLAVCLYVYLCFHVSVCTHLNVLVSLSSKYVSF